MQDLHGQGHRRRLPALRSSDLLCPVRAVPERLSSMQAADSGDSENLHVLSSPLFAEFDNNNFVC